MILWIFLFLPYYLYRTPSPWQSASGRQNFAQLTMAPIQSWSAVHPDFRSRTLVILSQTNVLLIRDYLTYFLEWEKRRENEAEGSNGNAMELEAPIPGIFVDLRFKEETPSPSDLSTAQLAVAESRAMCIIVSLPLKLGVWSRAHPWFCTTGPSDAIGPGSTAPLSQRYPQYSRTHPFTR